MDRHHNFIAFDFVAPAMRTQGQRVFFSRHFVATATTGRDSDYDCELEKDRHSRTVSFHTVPSNQLGYKGCGIKQHNVSLIDMLDDLLMVDTS
jgi:hypothetical protein